jgi:hypothetical protein
VSATVQVEETRGFTESGVHENPFNPGCMVTVPPLAEAANDSAVASAPKPWLTWTTEELCVLETETVRDTVAITPFEIGVVFTPHTTQVISPAVLLQDTVLLAAFDVGPAATTTDEKSLVE